jgi:bacillithiol biosynthesis cysteine-adding enzyme BshC
MIGRIPFEKYPGLPPLARDFRAGGMGLFPDSPTLEAAAARGREILGARAAVPATSLRYRGDAARRLAEDLAAGRAVAVVTGQQVGLFTGPMLTLLKTFDALRVARELTRRGVPAAAVFYALTDDHDLEEVAHTAKPGAEGVEKLVLEGADRHNRRPVGPLPIPEKIGELFDALRPDAKAPDAGEILEAFARRHAPGVSYRDAFAETLLDLTEGEPLLILDPMEPPAREAAATLLRATVDRAAEVREALRRRETEIERLGRSLPVASRDGALPFFLVENGERRRVDDAAAALRRIDAGTAWASADVMTRPVLKSRLLPTAASIVGPGEIAYHAQLMPLFEVLETPRPVLLSRTHAVLLGPAERRSIEALGISREDLLLEIPRPEAPEPEASHELRQITRETEARLDRLEEHLAQIDPTLSGALENTRKKVAHQLESLSGRIRKATDNRDALADRRRTRLETWLLPGGTPAERVYPPLTPMLSYGRLAVEGLAAAVDEEGDGVRVVDLGL